jgi:hypothetical protein
MMGFALLYPSYNGSFCSKSRAPCSNTSRLTLRILTAFQRGHINQL